MANAVFDAVLLKSVIPHAGLPVNKAINTKVNKTIKIILPMELNMPGILE